MLVLLSPLGLLLHMQTQSSGYDHQVQGMSQASSFFLAGGVGNLLLLLFILCLAALSFAITRAIRLKTTSETWRSCFPRALAAGARRDQLILLFPGKASLVEGSLIICLPPFILLASVGLSNIGPRWFFAAVLAVTLILSGNGLLAWYNDKTLAKKRTGEAPPHSFFRRPDPTTRPVLRFSVRSRSVLPWEAQYTEWCPRHRGVGLSFFSAGGRCLFPIWSC